MLLCLILFQCLQNIQNFFALTVILQGLTASFNESYCSELFVLINTQDNYTHYWRTFLRKEDLSHLLSHYIAYECCNNHDLQEIFDYISYKSDLFILQPFTQSEDYKPRQRSICLHWVENLWEYITQTSCLDSAWLFFSDFLCFVNLKSVFKDS